MKILGVAIGLQSLLILVLIYKVFALEAQQVKIMPQTKSNVQNINTDPNLNEASMSYVDVDYQKIQELIREEISKIKFSDNTAITSKQDSGYVDPYLLESIDNNVMNIISDGKITESELANIERQMINLSKKDRQRVLNKLAREASKNATLITPN